jgi:hypothetical protein
MRQNVKCTYKGHTTNHPIPKNLGMIEVIRQKEDDHILP